MEGIAIRELKQNPQAAIRRVLDAGEAVEITSYGQPIGVVIAPAAHTRRAWAPGSVLTSAVTPLPDETMNAWQKDLREGREHEFGRDLLRDDQ